MKTKVTLKFLDIVMQIGLVVPWIGGLPQDIVFLLGEILSLGKVRNKLLLLDPVQRLNTDL